MYSSTKNAFLTFKAQRTIINVLVFCVYISFLFNYALPTGITVSNIGLCLMILLLTAALIQSKGIKLSSVEISIFFLFVITFGVILFQSALVFLNSNHIHFNIKTFAIWASWFLMPFAFLFGLIFGKSVVDNKFQMVASWLSIVANALTLALILRLGIEHGGDLRYEVNKYLPGGINGYMFSMTWLQVLSLGIVYDSGLSIKKKIVGVLAFVCPILINGYLGSRQYAIAAIILIFAAIKNAKRGKEKISTILMVIIFVVGAFSIIALSDTIHSYLYQRLDKTQRQISGTSHGRIQLWSEALHLLDEDAILGGRGIGYSSTMMGRSVDNFWIEFIIDYGVLSSLLLLSSIFLTLNVIRKSTYKNFSKEKKRKQYFIYVGLVLTVCWYSIFNELLREYIVWLCMGVVVRRSKESNIQ